MKQLETELNQIYTDFFINLRNINTIFSILPALWFVIKIQNIEKHFKFAIFFVKFDCKY